MISQSLKYCRGASRTVAPPIFQLHPNRGKMENMHYAAHTCEPTFRAGNEPLSIISFSKLRCLTSCVLTVAFQLVAHGPAETARWLVAISTDDRQRHRLFFNHTALDAQGASWNRTPSRKTLRTVTQAAGPARLPLSCKAMVRNPPNYFFNGDLRIPPSLTLYPSLLREK